MLQARLASTALLLLATVGTLASAHVVRAQTPPEPTTDSATTDTTTKKKSRFGGLVQKAKTVAGNKAVQGAAKGVACTVVPGAAVSAATGTGPCANSGVVGSLMSGGAKAVAAGGVLGAMASVTGLSNAAAQAAALKIMTSTSATGMSSSAAQAAALQLMVQNGMSNANASAALMQMMKSKPPAANAADAAVAVQMLQAMGLRAGGTPAPPNPGTATAAAAPAPAAALWVNYDFVPGERVIYFADFTDDQVGNFPARLEFVEGNMEVAELGGRRVVRATSQSKLSIPLPEVLPQRFTIEIDVINRPSLDGADFHLRGSKGRIDDAKTSIISWGSDGASLVGGGGGEVRLSNNEANRTRYRGKAAQVRILGDGKYIKVYLDEKRVANVPNANFERSKVLHLVIDARDEANPAFISRIRVAESRKSLYDDLAANGRVVTQGLLFDTGSDRLRPESQPTLKMIASMIEQHPDLRVRIEGHTDNVGNAAANKALSDRRAAAVKAALVSEYRVSGGRLDAKGFGDTKPIGSNDTAEGRANNRRVELVKM
ncbi:MAG TPA: OmpA family protein [Gemmatimonadaceae bacterium]|jgi:outer membrane protein OmpA-like peptidoglycan-associated protein